MTITCPNCKHENPDGAQFCNGCGGKFVVKVEVVKAAEPEKPKKKVKDPGCIWLAVGFVVVMILLGAGGISQIGKNLTHAPAGLEKKTAVVLNSSTTGPTLTRTVTLTRTITPTASSTSTPLPAGTLTAQAQEMIQRATNNAKTTTAEAKKARMTEIAEYKTVYWKDLATYPEKYMGQKVVVRGLVYNVVSNIEVQLYFAGTWEPFYVVMAETFGDIYENNAIAVYGTVSENKCFDTQAGGHMCTPLLTDAFYTK